MIVKHTEIQGVFIIDNFKAKDNRGVFVKTFNENAFKASEIVFNIKESYLSISEKDVIRGMHFQLPPHDHEKLVYVASGAIIDVIVDLRNHSKTFKKFISVKLSSENGKSVFIPKGCAHGFKSLETGTITVYNVSSCYNAKSDEGIRYDSFGFDWEVESPVLSYRDQQFLSLDEFSNKNIF